jgi:two-component system, NtrC family, sensor kinase
MAGARVLVVDDEPGITALCERVLDRAGFSTQAFTDPIEALHYVHENRVDLLVVDIRMPALSGFDVIKDAHSQQPDMAVLVMTGFGTVETAIQALREGVDGLVLKPFERDEFLQAVHQALADKMNKQDVARMRALRPLFDITEALLAETHQERLLGLILNAVRGHLNCQHAGFYEFSESDHTLHLLAGRGKTLPDDASNSKGGAVGRAHSSGQLISVNATSFADPILHQQLADYNLATMMCVPTSLVNVRSVIFAGRERGEPPFREVDMEMFTILARQATIAMENARLYEELRAYVKRVEDSQQALIQAEKLATAGRMTASIAHEINNPLQAIRNCLHLVGRPDLADEKRSEYLVMAQSELERLAVTVQRMLEFYRPNVMRQPVQIHDLLNHVLSLMGQQLDQRHVQITTHISENLPPVMVVGSQIQQVFINLILNASDAMPNGGPLEITASLDKNFVEIIFQDGGSGVPVQLRDVIFEPFTSTKEGGTGLGLSVSYGIISAHGGTLELITEHKPGACFRITLPLAEQ